MICTYPPPGASAANPYGCETDQKASVVDALNLEKLLALVISKILDSESVSNVAWKA